MFGFTLLTLSPLGHLLIRFLALSVFLYGIGFGVLEYARRKGIDVFSTRKHRIVSGVIRNASKATILILGIAIGYGVRDHQLVDSTITYRNVLVQQRLAERRYRVIPQWMSRLDVELCQGPPIDWQEGDTLDEWTFEQQRGCKRVISYHKKQGELDASLSTR